MAYGNDSIVSCQRERIRMQICILSVGTRGDVQPYMALGRGLQAVGHQVQLAMPDVFEPVVRGYQGDSLSFALGIVMVLWW
jgi:hypothetical protein